MRTQAPVAMVLTTSELLPKPLHLGACTGAPGRGLLTGRREELYIHLSTRRGLGSLLASPAPGAKQRQVSLVQGSLCRVTPRLLVQVRLTPNLSATGEWNGQSAFVLHPSCPRDQSSNAGMAGSLR